MKIQKDQIENNSQFFANGGLVKPKTSVEYFDPTKTISQPQFPHLRFFFKNHKFG